MTPTVFGEPATPAAVTVTVAVWVPRARPAIDGATDSVAGALPLPGETASHGASSLTVKLSVPPPVLLTATSLEAGLAPPSGAVNVRLAGETASTGGGGSTVNVTGTVFGEPIAPGAPTVTSVV